MGQNVTNRSIITKEADKLNIDLRQLPNGIYIVKAKGNSVKIIKE
ncbi:MAG: hypothetical protein ACJAUH_000965 [Saprospiraceae bacterium]